MRTRTCLLAIIALLAAGPVAASASAPAAGEASTPRRVLAEIDDPALRNLIGEVLERNPALAAAAARARAAAHRAPQVKALPDPVAGLTAFLAPPETRTGPQRLSATFSQGLPWFGKLALREQAALHTAAALASEVDAEGLKLLTEARRLAYELAFLRRYREITRDFREHLVQHEEIARARYSTGVGLGQGVIKLQAEITRIDKELLGIESRRVQLATQLNRLRDRPATTPLALETSLEARETSLDPDALQAVAERARPELAAAAAHVARAQTLVQLAEKGYRPDFRVGLAYTVVAEREDAAGRLMPPPDNGDDIVGIQGGITLPLWRKRLAAGVEEAVALRTSAERARQDAVAAIRAQIGDLTQQVPLSWRQLRLVEDLLVVQAEEALESAQAAYVAGTLNALDLLDAEHVLFEAHTAVARARADYLVGLARLEGAVGESLRASLATE